MEIWLCSIAKSVFCPYSQSILPTWFHQIQLLCFTKDFTPSIIFFLKYKVWFNIISWKYKVVLSTTPNFSPLRQEEGPWHQILSSSCSPLDCHHFCLKLQSKIHLEASQPFWQTSESHKNMPKWYLHHAIFLGIFCQINEKGAHFLTKQWNSG